MFLDANVLYSAAYKAASPLRALWELADAELWASEAAVAEALGNLRIDRPEQVPELHRLIARLKVRVGDVEPVELPEGVTLPAKDRPVFGAAVRAEATHFVTGDKKHFGPYFDHTVSGVLILTPGNYLRSRRPGP